MTSTILEGSYVIQSAAFSRPFIGRNVIETPLPSPKPIFSLPLDVAFLQPWIVKKATSGDGYIFQAGNGTAEAIDGKLFADPTDEHQTEWVLTKHADFGFFAFTVQTTDKSNGWVVPSEEPLTQVDVKPLSTSNGKPNANEVFIFTRIV